MFIGINLHHLSFRANETCMLYYTQMYIQCSTCLGRFSAEDYTHPRHSCSSTEKKTSKPSAEEVKFIKKKIGQSMWKHVFDGVPVDITIPEENVVVSVHPGKLNCMVGYHRTNLGKDWEVKDLTGAEIMDLARQDHVRAITQQGLFKLF
jgi:hypothetical protein